ncbi:MAG: hypothetical protein WBL68_01220 [Nitrososphaeraceae archaeon]
MNINSTKPCVGKKNTSFNDRNYAGQWSIVGALVILISSLTISISAFSGASLQSFPVTAAVDIDTSGDGRAAAYDGEEGIATNGDSFCSITNDIAGGKFSSLFEGIVGDCDNNSQLSNQFLVEYSYTKNPVKIGEKTYLTITVKDKETGNPVSNAFVTLDVEPHTISSVDSTIGGAAVAAAGISSNSDAVKDKTTQAMYTDNSGHATFTLQIGPKSDLGIYDTQFEIRKDSYQSSFQQTNLRVV